MGPIMEREYLLIYEIAIASFGTLFITALMFWLRREEAKRLQVVENLTRFVATDDDPNQLKGTRNSRARATQSIETRFAIIRRILVPLVIVVIFLLMILPYLPELPAAAITLTVAGGTVLLGVLSKTYLENFLAGLVLSFTQPLRIGDVIVIDDRFGIVEELNLTYTVIKLWDWSRYIVPNETILKQKYLNLTLNDKLQWAYITFWVGYGTDVDLVKKLAIDACYQSSYHIQNQVPGFWIMETNKEGYVCWLSGWVNHPINAWTLRNEMRTEIIKSFQAHGIRAHTYHHDIHAQSQNPLSTIET